MAANQREKLLASRNSKIAENYNRTAHTLPGLSVSDYVAIQNQNTKRWERSGRVVEVMPNRQYRIKVDGSGRVTLRNRIFLRKIPSPHPQVIPAAAVPVTRTGSTIPSTVVSEQDISTDPPHRPTNTSDRESDALINQSRALARLAPHNNPGVQELPRNTRRRGGEGGGEVQNDV